MQTIQWTKLINNPIDLEVLTKRLPSKGNLVYEYNPFRNYRLNSNMYEFKNSIYSLGDLWRLFNISIKCKACRSKVNNIYLYKINPTTIPDKWESVDKPEDFGAWIELAYSKGHNIDRINLEQALINSKISNSWYNVPATETDPVLREKGELVDFITDELSFNLNHPVNIIPQYSYDGSVNLILNDGINIPRLINSRFSATGKNTYEIVDRKGNNDTNIYDLGDLFDIDTSLYKRIIKIPKIHFKGLSAGGNNKIGNYHFYFKLSDADGNETDFIGESGLVSVFIGFNDPSAIHTGTKELNSFKQIQFLISNIDASYDYVTVYYTRTTSELYKNKITEYIKIDKKYLVNNAEICNITVTGFETTIPISNDEINLSYNTVDSVITSATCLNMLFLANVHKPDIPYEELSDLSLRFLPYLKLETYDVDMDLTYSISTSNRGYVDPLYIYNKTGYWGKEIYRFGIVYILNNGELSPVFNIRGGANISEYAKDVYENIEVFSIDPNSGKKIRNHIEYDEEHFTLLHNKAKLENIKGVVSFLPTKDTNTIYSVDIRVDDDTISELKKYVKGYFFVRQSRIPLVLALGITIGIDKEAHTPTIPTADGFLTELSDSLSKTHVTTEDINDVNFISEGFLKRYSFEIKKKKSSLFGKILKGIGIGIAVVVAAAATVYTAGAAGAIIGGTAATLSGAAAAGATAVGTMATAVAGTVGLSTGVVGTIAATAGVVGAASGIGIAAAGGIQELRYGVASIFAKKKLDGRNTVAPAGYKLVELEDSRKLVHDFKDRFIPKDPSNNIVAGILCPDYELDLYTYNLIFTGNEHLIELTNSLNINCLNGHSSNYFTNKDRHFYVPSYYDRNVNTCYYLKIVAVPDGVKCVGIDDLKFRSKAGEAEEAWRYECIAEDYKSDYSKKNVDEDTETISNKKINTDIIRGNFGPYLGLGDDLNRFLPAETVNIYIPGYSPTNFEKYFYIRMTDNSVFKAITERFDISDIKNYKVTLSNLVGEIDNSGYQFNVYRGDCYLCQFTHRINRNFNDPSAPYNDDIVDENTWKDHYNPDKTEEYANINLGDVNAILLGMWVTFRVRSSKNLNIRTLDGSNVDETAMCGHEHGFYPYMPMSVEGNYKHPESQIYNKGFSVNLSERWNFEVPDVPHIKNWFGTRIMYSDIHINDAYKNGFRVFLGTNYRDYTREYGEIVKLISLESNLLCIFEHGVALIPVNKEAVIQQSTESPFLTIHNVLPESPKIISDMYGSQWADSVLKVPGKSGNTIQYVYGVDTVAKKIWRTDGTKLECISDFRVQEFLNNNITLGERELTPKLGIRNVKTVYNAFKHDVLFTFYDDTYGFEEKVWNLCWNELLLKFITFYSWVPSFMENINNVPFSFNRDVSKWLAKLGTSHTENSLANGITLSNVLIEDTLKDNNGPAVTNMRFPITYLTKLGDLKTIYCDAIGANKFIGVLSLSNRLLPESKVRYDIHYTLERDNYGNRDSFEIVPIGCVYNGHTYSASEGFILPEDALYAGESVRLEALCFKSGSNDEYHPVYYKDSDEKFLEVKDEIGNIVCIYRPIYTPESLYSELYYRNSAKHVYADVDAHKLGTDTLDINYAPVDLNATFTATDVQWIADTLTIPIEEALKYVGQSKCWVKDEPTLRLFEALYPPLTIVGFNSTEYNGDNPPITAYPCTNMGEIRSITTNIEQDQGAASIHGIRLDLHWVIELAVESKERKVWYELPIFKDLTGKRPMLPYSEQINPHKLVTLLNIKAHISIIEDTNKSSLNTSVLDITTIKNMSATYAKGSSLIDAGYYESTIAIAPKWNLLFLTSDFWKHGQAGIIDIADEIFPTYWYGRQHPFEFECVVVNDPAVHKIFSNLELVANKAKPESFHYEIIGECYDFAKDKPNMYFRLEAMKALWLYNGADIAYNRNFLKVIPKQNNKSADLIHRYYTRLDTINNIEDYYIKVTAPNGHDYNHLSGAEIVYYPTRQEFRIWNHALAIDMDDLPQDDSRSIITANCKYLEDRWKVTINPILVCYKNEFVKGLSNSTWAWAKNSSRLLPSLPIYNSPIPDQVLLAGMIKFPEGDYGMDNALYDLYDLSKYGVDSWKPLDLSNWLNGTDEHGNPINKYNYFGEASNRKEVDLKDKFMKVRIRYSGEDLAVIDFLNTVYRISYA